MANGRHRVVVVGGGFGGLNVARMLWPTARWTSRSSIAPTITSSSRCSTRSRPASCRPG